MGGLKIATYCEGPFLFAKGLQDLLNTDTSDDDLGDFFEFVLASDLETREKTCERFGLLPHLLALEKIAKFEVDATDSHSFDNVDIAVIGAPYGRTPADTRGVLCPSIVDALSQSNVQHVILLGRHQSANNEKGNFGRPSLYQAFFESFDFREARYAAKGTPLVPGYRHFFTACGANEDTLAHGAKMFAVWFERKESAPTTAAVAARAATGKAAKPPAHNRTPSDLVEAADDSTKPIVELLRAIQKKILG